VEEDGVGVSSQVRNLSDFVENAERFLQTRAMRDYAASGAWTIAVQVREVGFGVGTRLA